MKSFKFLRKNKVLFIQCALVVVTSLAVLAAVEVFFPSEKSAELATSSSSSVPKPLTDSVKTNSPSPQAEAIPSNSTRKPAPTKNCEAIQAASIDTQKKILQNEYEIYLLDKAPSLRNQEISEADRQLEIDMAYNAYQIRFDSRMIQYRTSMYNSSGCVTTFKPAYLPK